MDLRKIISSKIVHYATIFVLGVFFTGCGSASAASLQINSNATTLAPGDTALLTVTVNSGGVAINNAEATILFPTNLLSVISVSKASSIFSLWVEEPSFSNSLGTIAFNGGLPTPGFDGPQGTVLSVIVRAKAAGSAEFSFSGAAVRANDGFGTNVLVSSLGKSLVIAPSENRASTPPPSSSVDTSALALKISSPTHQVGDQWYNNANPKFQWVVPAGADAIQTSMSTDATSVPRVLYSPAISEKIIPDLEDGTWYFKARARKNGSWGPTASYVVHIDTSAPEKKSATFSYNEDAKMLTINLEVKDAASGIDKYEVSVNNVRVKTFSEKEVVDGKHSFALNAFGANNVKLSVIDYAGNRIEVSDTFYSSTAGIPQVVSLMMAAKKQLMVTVGPLAVAALPLGIVLLTIVVAFAGLSYYFGHRRSSLRRRMKARKGLLTKSEGLSLLLDVKKRLEKHLELLQHIRRSRVLTTEEKEIKAEIENDLDEIDREIDMQK